MELKKNTIITGTILLVSTSVIQIRHYTAW